MSLKQWKMKQKRKKSRFRGLLLYTLGASLLGKMFATPRVGITDKGVIRAGDQVIWACENCWYDLIL